MSRTIKMTFNVQNRTFDLGYLNYEVDKSVRNSIVHCYYLSIDTRLSQFIDFLVTNFPEQERQSKINNIRQIVLKVTFARKSQVFYNLIIKGDTTGVMTFKPSEFLNCEEESNLTDLEPLIDSIINEEDESYNLLGFQLNDPDRLTMALRNFTVSYSDHDYFRNRGNHIYDVVVDSNSLEFLEFLRTHYPSVNPISSDIEEMYVRVSEKKKIASLIVYPTNNSQYEQIDFVPLLLEDSDPSNSLPKFSLPFNEPVSKSPPVVTESKVKVGKPANTELDIISICREIVNASDKASEKIKQLRDLLIQ